MAFLVCYSQSPPDDHARCRAIYLDQRFYEMIFRHCRSDNVSYTILRAIALLRYKSPVMVVSGGQVEQLDRELTDFEAAGLSHRQIPEFRRVCHTAKTTACALTISGDMYPEL